MECWNKLVLFVTFNELYWDFVRSVKVVGMRSFVYLP